MPLASQPQLLNESYHEDDDIEGDTKYDEADQAPPKDFLAFKHAYVVGKPEKMVGCQGYATLVHYLPQVQHSSLEGLHAYDVSELKQGQEKIAPYLQVRAVVYEED